MCKWVGCWGSVRHVWMGRVLGECEACRNGEGVGECEACVDGEDVGECEACVDGEGVEGV